MKRPPSVWLIGEMAALPLRSAWRVQQTESGRVEFFAFLTQVRHQLCTARQYLVTDGPCQRTGLSR
jgi:hypothetical protein